MLRQRAIVAGLIAAALLPAVAQGSTAASPVRNGRIAWVRATAAHTFEILTMTPRGTRRRRLTNVDANTWPAFSPDGKQIVYTRIGRQADLWLMNANGSDKRRLSHTRRPDELAPAWSPDGKRIVFEAGGADNALRGLWVIGVDGRGLRRLTDGVGVDPSWSPDGRTIAYTADGAIWTIPAAGGTPSQLTVPPAQPAGVYYDADPAWSPDGSQIAFVSNRAGNGAELDVWVVNADGSDPRQITNTPHRDEHDPAWSPTGRWVVFDSTGSYRPATSQLFVIRVDGTGLHPLTHDPGWNGVENMEPTWAPLAR